MLGWREWTIPLPSYNTPVLPELASAGSESAFDYRVAAVVSVGSETAAPAFEAASFVLVNVRN